MPTVAAPPGPKFSLLGTLIYYPGRDPLGFFTNLARTYGDLVSYRMGGEQIFFVNDPQIIKDILVTHARISSRAAACSAPSRCSARGC